MVGETLGAKQNYKNKLACGYSTDHILVSYTGQEWTVLFVH